MTLTNNDGFIVEQYKAPAIQRAYIQGEKIKQVYKNVNVENSVK